MRQLPHLVIHLAKLADFMIEQALLAISTSTSVALHFISKLF